MEYKEVNPGPEVGQEVQDSSEILKRHLKSRRYFNCFVCFSRGIKAEYLVEIAKITAEKEGQTSN